ncbi:MAG: hypothetical protein ACOX3R_13415 [Desulfitobacteriia bacterium]
MLNIINRLLLADAVRPQIRGRQGGRPLEPTQFLVRYIAEMCNKGCVIPPLFINKKIAVFASLK